MINRITRAVGVLLGRGESRGIKGEELWAPSPTLAGVDVTPSTALGLTAVYAAINAIATDCASLPLGVSRRLPNGLGRAPAPEHPAHDLISVTPDDGITTAFHFKQTLIGHALGWGNGYAEILPRKDGRPHSLYLLNPSVITPRIIEGKLRYDLGNGTSLPPSRIIHVRGLGFDGIKGYSVVHLHRQALGLATAAEAFGALFFGNGSSPKGFLKHPKRLGEEAEKTLREAWERIHSGLGNSHRLAILEEGMDWVQTSVNPDDAQFLATRQFQILEICRMFRCPPNKLADLAQSHLNNIESSNLDYLTNTLGGWLLAVESELNLKLFTKAERAQYFADHDMTALLRGDSAARAKYLREMFNMGAYSTNEVRAFEGLNPIGPDGDRRFAPASFTTLDKVGVAPAGVSTPAKPTEPAEAGETLAA